jgi:hypothetical protein
MRMNDCLYTEELRNLSRYFMKSKMRWAVHVAGMKKKKVVREFC